MFFLIYAMKTSKLCAWTAVGASLFTLTPAFKASADQTATAAKPEKTYTGTVNAVDLNGRTLDVKGFILSKQFNLGDHCAYALWNQPAGAINDLRPGEKVTVAYQDAHGVLVADSVKQVPMTCRGMVKSIDPAMHSMTLRAGPVDRKIQIPDDCVVALHGGKTGTLADVAVGDHVTVTYETPNDRMTARQIAQTSDLFTGLVTGVDLTEQTVKAKAPFGSKEFHLADNCAIVVNGKTDGKLSGLKLGERLTFNYDDVNGVNIVNRIGAAPPQETETTSIQPMMP
jgi:Cu/Ag efflux protein CusF